MLYKIVSIVLYCTPQLGHFLRKDDSCDGTLVIYIVLFIYAVQCTLGWSVEIFVDQTEQVK